MTKRFRLRIPSFQCCRPKDTFTLSDDPPPPSKSPLSSFRHVSAAFRNSDDPHRTGSPYYDAVLSPSEKNKKKKPKRRHRKKKTMPETGLFLSSAGDSSPEPNPQKTKKKKKKKKKKRTMTMTSSSPENTSPARLSVFQRLIPCTVEGKVRESFAVVKKSEDPYEDFKKSMVEMIMEKEMFEERDLEQLLHCLLCLNQKEHHGIIVEAFSEIWRSLFCRISGSRTSSDQSKLFD